MNKTAPTTIDAYISGFDPAIQERLQIIRQRIKKAAPKAEETIKYGMPMFVLHGNAVGFAAFKKHIGLYPAPHAHPDFKKELLPYKGTKSSMHIAHDGKIPLALIARIVKFRVKELAAKAAKKKK
jgi:uncharacterized protein YdhG (YjbR/CyaY superfamily)